MGNLARRTKDAFDSLCEKQQEILTNPTTQNIVDEAEAFASWTHLAELEEGFYKQRSKLHWLQVGDQNTKIFHRATTTRKLKNEIKEIKGPSGEIFKKIYEIKNQAERFFHEFLTHKPEDYVGTSIENLEELLNFRCSDFQKANLVRDVTDEEIRKFLFSIK